MCISCCWAGLWQYILVLVEAKSHLQVSTVLHIPLIPLSRAGNHKPSQISKFLTLAEQAAKAWLFVRLHSHHPHLESVYFSRVQCQALPDTIRIKNGKTTKKTHPTSQRGFDISPTILVQISEFSHFQLNKVCPQIFLHILF